MIDGQATFFDGRTARVHKVSISLAGADLRVVGEHLNSPVAWSVDGLTAAARLRDDEPLRLSHVSMPAARLVVPQSQLAEAIRIAAPQLKPESGGSQFVRYGAWFVGCLAVLLAVGYFTMTYAPQQFAGLVPRSWSLRFGENLEKSLVETAKRCSSSESDRALSAIAAALAEGNPDMPAVRIRVYDMPLVNAFTLTGGLVVLTRGLIDKADRPEEVAGVLAHEIGHAALLHPEAQLIRVTGLQLLLSVVSGGSANSNTAGLAGLAAILRSSRDAEREADAYAIAMLTAARIDPLGFKSFFEKVSADRPAIANQTLSAIGNIFATHPGVAERMNAIQPLPAGVAARPVMSDAQWQALRKICN
jgi:beta-barrel assembly-enhancing protease